MKRAGVCRLALLVVFAIAGLAPASRLAIAQGTPGAIVEPNDGRDPILTFISTAQVTIDVAIYELTDRRAIGALEAAPARGVRVRVLAEPMPGGRAANSSSLARLRSAGVLVRDSSPAFRLTHEKAIVVDGAAALIMSLNLVAESFSGSRDVAIVDDDAADVAEIEAVFEADWDRRPVLPTQPNLVWSPDNARPRMLALLSSATAELDCYAEELTDPGVLAALAGAAANGVHVRLLMTDRGSSDSARPRRALLQAEGVEVRLLEKPFVHAKVVLVDGQRLFAGSENFTAASLDQNRELGILTSDPALLGRLVVVFDQDWQRATPAGPSP